MNEVFKSGVAGDGGSEGIVDEATAVGCADAAGSLPKAGLRQGESGKKVGERVGRRPFVSIKYGHKFTLRKVVEGFIEGGGFTDVLGKGEEMPVGVLVHELLAKTAAFILRPIIHQHDGQTLCRIIELGYHWQKLTEVSGFVMKGDEEETGGSRGTGGWRGSLYAPFPALPITQSPRR